MVQGVYSFRWQGPQYKAKTRRERFAWMLRRWADRLTGHQSYAVHIYSWPAIHPHEQAYVMQKAMDHAGDLVEELVRSDLADRAARQRFPDPPGCEPGPKRAH